MNWVAYRRKHRVRSQPKVQLCSQVCCFCLRLFLHDGIKSVIGVHSASPECFPFPIAELEAGVRVPVSEQSTIHLHGHVLVIDYYVL